MKPVQDYFQATTLMQAYGMKGSDRAVRRRLSLLAVDGRYAILCEAMFPDLRVNSMYDGSPAYQVFYLKGKGSLTTYTWEEICKEWTRLFQDVSERANFRPLKWSAVDIRRLEEQKAGSWVWTPEVEDYMSDCREIIVWPNETREEFVRRQTAWKAWVQRFDSNITPMEF